MYRFLKTVHTSLQGSCVTNWICNTQIQWNMNGALKNHNEYISIVYPRHHKRLAIYTNVKGTSEISIRKWNASLFPLFISILNDLPAAIRQRSIIG